MSCISFVHAAVSSSSFSITIKGQGVKLYQLTLYLDDPDDPRIDLSPLCMLSHFLLTFVTANVSIVLLDGKHHPIRS